MPSMFTRSRRGSSASRHSNAPLDQSTRSNAATAAAQAFLSQQQPNGTLSNAAAAAALRSATSSPEPVGSIQTKRMIRRGSNASTGSGSIMGGRGGGGRGGMQRRDSAGSMTERTFRSPTPGSRGSGAISPAYNAPPVPPIPQNLQARHQRASSLDPPQRVLSPTPGRGARATSMDRRPPPASTNTGRPPKRLSNVNEELERTNGTDKQYTHGTGHWFSESVGDPASSSKQPANKTALEQKIDRIHAAAGQPVRRDHSVDSSQGTYLQRANQQSELERPTASRTPSYETADAIMVYDPNSRTFIPQPRPKPKAPTIPTPAPVQPQEPQLPPGSYDPHTRTIVPHPEPKTLSQASQKRVNTMAAVDRQRPALDTSVAPPPRNPARLSPVISPSAKALHKQPSVVHEKPEEEDLQASQVQSERVGFIQTSAGPVKSYIAPATRQQRSSSLDIPRGSFEGAVRGRGTSTSPSRHTHFSATPVTAASRHDPPPRNISPMKSALKHSPASSIRTSSPLANFSPAPRSPSSETSDNTSQASQDAFSSRKKKSVRVSFDEQPHVVQTTTPAVTRGPLDDWDDDELSKPRPALPSFGSVRKQRNPTIAEKVTEMPPERHESSSDHAVGGILRNAQDVGGAKEPVPPEVTSNERADDVADESDSELAELAGLADKIASPESQSQPSAVLPDTSKTEVPIVRDFAAVATPEQNDNLDVPAINLLPPTPGVEEENRTLSPDTSPKAKQSFEINVPGGWAGDGGNEAEVESARAAKATASAVEVQGPGDGIPEPIIYESPIEHSPMLDPIDESDDSAEFSDAAEDPSEFENGGFASLDAIAVSPVINPSPAVTSAADPADTASPPASPTARQTLKKASRAETESNSGSGDWTQATAYWSQLSRQQREAIEREHLSSDDEARPSVPIVRKKKSALKSTAAPAQPAAQAAPQPTMRKTMRGDPVTNSEPGSTVNGDVHMRRSMRAGGDTVSKATSQRTGGMATTLRNGRPPPRQRQDASQPSPRMANGSMRLQSSSPQVSVGPGASAAGASMANQRQEQQSSTTQDPPQISAKLQKELSHDSDSESSFKKKRRPSVSTVDAQGRFSMKQSMRGGPAASPPMRNARPASPDRVRGKGKDSFSIRSLSPTGSFFNRKKRGDEVRQSIRAPSTDGGTRLTMRNSPAQKTMRPQKPQQAKPPRFKSRFADSDSEDDDRPARGMFKSRFATESDDEDDDVFIPADLRPVRGIPKRQGQTDGDSTDLEDEDEVSRTNSRAGRENLATPGVPDSADIDAAMEIARKKLGMANLPTQEPAGNQGGALQKGSLRKNSVDRPEPKSKLDDVDVTPKRRGFMSGILRRNRDSSSSVAQVSTPPSRQGAAPVLPIPALAGPIAPAVDATADQSQPSSPAVSPAVSPVAKLVRRSSAQQAPRFRRGDSTFSTYSNMTAPPAVGESRVSEWSVPPPVPRIPSYFRPNTSDGSGAVDGKVRFDDGGELTLNAAAEGRGGIYSARTGKKKKFGLLRKAFGLND